MKFLGFASGEQIRSRKRRESEAFDRILFRNLSGIVF